jgi:hypothetical protein
MLCQIAYCFQLRCRYVKESMQKGVVILGSQGEIEAAIPGNEIIFYLGAHDTKPRICMNGSDLI